MGHHPVEHFEGCARESLADYIRFLDIAYGSARELEYQVTLAHRLGFLSDRSGAVLQSRAEEANKVLNGLLRDLRQRKQLPPRKVKAGREVRELLESLGICKGNGRETLRGCVTVPVTDESGAIVAIEGHRLDAVVERDAAIHARTNKPLKFATQASYLVAVKHWIGWLVEEGRLETNPAEKLQLPKEEHRLPSGYLTLDEVETLLGVVDLSTPSGLRDRAILETLYSTGIQRRGSCHMIRHTTATLMLEGGADLRQYPGTAGAQRCEDDDDLHPRHEPARTGGDKPAGSDEGNRRFGVIQEWERPVASAVPLTDQVEGES